MLFRSPLNADALDDFADVVGNLHQLYSLLHDGKIEDASGQVDEEELTKEDISEILNELKPDERKQEIDASIKGIIATFPEAVKDDVKSICNIIQTLDEHLVKAIIEEATKQLSDPSLEDAYAPQSDRLFTSGGSPKPVVERTGLEKTS